MADYKRNHTIPEFMIRFWATMPDVEYWTTRPGVPPYEGVWVYDIAKKRSSFVGGDFKFAVRNDVYVPKIDDERAVSVEQWLGELENELAKLARQLHARTEPVTIKNHTDAVKALMALFSLECRSPHNIAGAAEALEQDRAHVLVLRERGCAPVRSSKFRAARNATVHCTDEPCDRLGGGGDTWCGV